jgi:hypothetical protein
MNPRMGTIKPIDYSIAGQKFSLACSGVGPVQSPDEVIRSVNLLVAPYVPFHYSTDIQLDVI